MLLLLLLAATDWRALSRSHCGCCCCCHFCGGKKEKAREKKQKAFPIWRHEIAWEREGCRYRRTPTCKYAISADGNCKLRLHRHSFYLDCTWSYVFRSVCRWIRARKSCKTSAIYLQPFVLYPPPSSIFRLYIQKRTKKRLAKQKKRAKRRRQCRRRRRQRQRPTMWRPKNRVSEERLF